MSEKVVRVGRSAIDGRWWAQPSGTTRFDSYASFDDLPDTYKPKLAVLLVSEEGYRNERVGRKISDDAYWLFF